MFTRTSLTFIVFTMICSVAYGQGQEFIIGPGQRISQVIPKHHWYQYPDFQNGILILKNRNKLGNIKLNYNMMTHNIDFLNDKRDTTEAVNNPNVEFIQIGETQFYHDYTGGYFEVIGSSDSTLLVSQKGYNVRRTERLVSDGYTTMSQSMVSTYTNTSAFSGQNGSNNVTIMRLERLFFLVNHKKEICIANKSGFLRVFPGYKKAVRNFAMGQHIKFHKYDDVVRIFEYLNVRN